MIKKYFLTLVLVFSFAVAPAVSADTVSDLQAQIGAILTQIASLKAQIDASQVSGNSGGSGQTSVSVVTTSTSSTDNSCFLFDKSLRVGDKGTDVLVLQRILKKEGFAVPVYAENGIDGAPIFDEITASSVVAFQEKYASEILTPNGLSHGTGFVGVSTREKLNKLSNCDQPVVTQTPACYMFSKNLTIGSTGEDVTALQTWLIAKGYDIPGISLGQVAKGYFGPSTAAAVSKLQKDKGIAGDLGSFGPLTRQLVTCPPNENDKSSITVLSPNGGEAWTIRDYSNNQVAR